MTLSARCPLIVVAICTAIAEGLMQPWIPAVVSVSAHKIPSTTELPPSPVDKKRAAAAGGKQPSTAAPAKPTKTKFSFSAEAVTQLKTAVEVQFISVVFCYRAGF